MSKDAQPRDASSNTDPGDLLRPLTDRSVNDDVIRGLVDAAPDGIVMTDHGGRIVLVNRQTEQLFGYDRSDLLGQSVEALIPERLRDLHRSHRARYEEDPQTRPMGVGLELVARRREGTEFRVEISLSPLLVGSELFVVAAVRDITERVAAEATMRRIQELLDSTRDGIYISDSETLRFTYVNQGAVDQVGYSRDELMRMAIPDIAPEFDESRWRSLVEPLGGPTLSSTMFTTLLVDRDGTRIPVEILLQAGEIEDDRPKAFVSIVRDITERIEVEERLRRTDQELRLVEDRERIARDLHDTVIQRLFAAGMTLQAVSSLPGSGDAAKRIDGVVDELDETIRELRNAIYGLQAQDARRDGLRHEVLRVLEDERSALGTDPELRLDGMIDEIPEDVGGHLVATLREGLSNVARHARATQVEVVIEARDEIVLRIVDDGVGIPDRAPRGNGLENMEARARRLGGRFRVNPGERAGTVLEWRIPHRGPTREEP